MAIGDLPLPPVGPSMMGDGGGLDPAAGTPPSPLSGVGGIASMLGAAPNPSDVIVEKLRPAVRMVSELADYISQSPELAPFVQAFMQMMLGAKGGRGGRTGRPQTASGLMSPASVASGPGPVAPGMPRPPAM